MGMEGRGVDSWRYYEKIQLLVRKIRLNHLIVTKKKTIIEINGTPSSVGNQPILCP